MASSTCVTTVAAFGNYWGSGFGGGLSFEIGGPAPTYGPFDLFCFCGGAINELPGFLNVEATPGDVAHGFPDTVDNGYYLVSEDGTASRIFVDQSLGPTNTLEAVFRLDAAPSDFVTGTRRIFLGAYDDTLFCQGLFVTQVGLAFGGAYDDNPLLLADSADLVQAGQTYVVRMVLSGEQEAVYIYWSTEEEAELLGGPVLRYTLPLLASSEVPAHQEGVYVDVLGTADQPCQIVLRSLCASSSALVDNMPPKADPGPDQVVAGCSIIRLDGSKSSDPEGGPLSYYWRVIDAPEESRYVDSGGDGHTPEDVDGFVSKLYTMHAGATDPFDFSPGDVLMVEGAPYTLVSAGTDMGGDYFQISGDMLPAGRLGLSFKVVRQGGFLVSSDVIATYLPDVLGIYRFDLRVKDASLFSPTTEVLVNVVSVNAPRGIAPDSSFVWEYMSDVTRLIQDGERVEVVWAGIMQVIGAELLNLWGTDYNKSLKDIQRTLARRWLHYDLLLREPFPHLCLNRSLWEGVLSSSLAPSGVAFGGQVLVLSLPYRDQLVTVMAQGNHTSPSQLASYLQIKLKEVDDRFQVSVVNVGANRKIRLYAPFPFTVVAGTTLPWTPSSTNAPLRGTGATSPAASTLKVGKSLEGIPIAPYDILVLKTGTGFVLNTVASVQDIAGDSFRKERITLSDPLPPGFTGEWAFALQVKSPQLDLWEGQVHAGDPVVLEVSDRKGGVSHLRLPSLGARGDNKRVAAVYPDEALLPYLAAPSRFDVQLWGVYRRTALPVDPLVRNIPFLQRLIYGGSEDEVLRENLDYRIEVSRGSSALVFNNIWVGDPLPRLWAEYTYLDNAPAIESNFGEAVGLRQTDLSKLTTSTDYLSAVRGLWYAYFRGSRVANLRTGAQVLLGLPFAEQAGRVIDVNTTYSSRSGRIVLQDSEAPNLVRSYTYPRVLGLETNPTTSKPYEVGDSVAQFAPLVRGVEVVDYVNDPGWITPFLSQGLLYETDKFHRFLVRVDLEAFSLPSLLFIKAFLARIKPLRVRPLFLARKVNDASDTVDVTDQLKATIFLSLYESPHARRAWSLGTVPPGPTRERSAAAMMDQPDPSPGEITDGARLPVGLRSGHVASAFDVGADPDNEPTPQTADLNLGWGFDLMYIRPESHITGLLSLNYNGIAAMTVFNKLAATTQPVFTARPMNFGQQWLTGTLNGVQLREPQAPLSNHTVNYAEVVLKGTPPAGGHDYLLQVYKNNVLVLSLPFTHSADNQRISWGPSPAPLALPDPSFAVTTSDTVKVVLSSDEPAPARYVLKSITLALGPAIGWSSGGPALPAATYYAMRTL